MTLTTSGYLRILVNQLEKDSTPMSSGDDTYRDWLLGNIENKTKKKLK